MSCLSLWSAEDTFDELFKLAPEKVHTVKEVGEIKASHAGWVLADRREGFLSPQVEVA